MKTYQLRIGTFIAYIEGADEENALLGMFCEPRPDVKPLGKLYDESMFGIESSGEGTIVALVVEVEM